MRVRRSRLRLLVLHVFTLETLFADRSGKQIALSELHTLLQHVGSLRIVFNTFNDDIDVVLGNQLEDLLGFVLLAARETAAIELDVIRNPIGQPLL